MKKICAIHNLINLALPKNDDLAAYGVEETTPVMSELNNAIKEAQEQERKDLIKQAAADVMTALRNADNAIECTVNEIRQVRMTEKMLLSKVDAIARAKAYGLKTTNFIPLLLELGINVGLVPNGLDTIPVDFKVDKPKAPATKSVKAVATKK